MTRLLLVVLVLLATGCSCLQYGSRIYPQFPQGCDYPDPDAPLSESAP